MDARKHQDAREDLFFFTEGAADDGRIIHFSKERKGKRGGNLDAVKEKAGAYLHLHLKGQHSGGGRFFNFCGRKESQHLKGKVSPPTIETKDRTALPRRKKHEQLFRDMPVLWRGKRREKKKGKKSSY